MIVSIAAVGIASIVAFGIVPANGGMVSGITTTVDNSHGDQTEPSVDNDLAAYTDVNSGRIRYFDFFTSTSTPIPGAPTDIDTLSNVNGTRISFSRQRHGPPVSRACMVFDVTSSTLVEIAPGSGVSAWQTSLGGDTVAFVDGVSPSNDLKVGKISNPTAPLASVGVPGGYNLAPAVSPDGSAVVWENCPTFTNCGIMKSTFSGSWSVAAVVSDTSSQESSPDTDGVHVVYDSDRPASVGGRDIYFQLLAGSPETQLEMAGEQRDPTISQGVIAFQSIAPGGASDLFVYVINNNTVWRVTDTPTVNEILSDIDVLPNGDIRVIWAADDDIGFANNIYATTFALPTPTPTPTPSLVTINYDAFVTTSSGPHAGSFPAGERILVTYQLDPGVTDNNANPGAGVFFNAVRSLTISFPGLSLQANGGPAGLSQTFDNVTDPSGTSSDQVFFFGGPITSASTLNGEAISGIEVDFLSDFIVPPPDPSMLSSDALPLAALPLIDAFAIINTSSGTTYVHFGSTPSPTPTPTPTPTPPPGLIVFTSNRDGNNEIYVMDANGSNPTRLTNNAANDQQPAWSADGTKIAFVSDRDGNQEIYVMDSNGFNQTRLTVNAAPDLNPAWSPNGLKIAFTRAFSGNTQIFVMDAANGGNQTALTADPVGSYAPTWSPDGTMIAYASERDVLGFPEIYVMNSDGSNSSNPLRLTNNNVFDDLPDWSADGLRIAFWSGRDSNDPEIYSMDPDGNNPTRITNISGNDIDPSWSQDASQKVFTTSRNGNFEIYRMNSDGSVQTNLTNNSAQDQQPDWQWTTLVPPPLDTDGDTIPDATDNCPLVPNPDQADSDGDGLGNICDNCPSNANPERVAFVSTRSGDDDVYLMDPNGSNVLRLTTDTGFVFNPTISPNGANVAFTNLANGNYEIYSLLSYGPGGGLTNPLINLTNNAAVDDHPGYSPDGSKIVFRSTRDNDSEIYVMNSDGTAPTRLTTVVGDDMDPSFSPDGSKIVFISHRNGNWEVYKMNADGSGQTRLTNNSFGEGQPTFSPDGSKIAFVSDRDGNAEIYVMDSDGTNQTRLTTDPAEDSYPAFSPSGTKLMFSTRRNSPAYDLYAMNADGTGQSPVVGGADWDYDSFWGRQPDFDRDSLGDACDPDTDGDGQTNVHEVLCGSNPIDPASRAPDNDGDNVPDCADLDDDNDGVLDFVDNCDFTANPDQANTDGDGLGNACDPDDDNDGVSDGADNCPLNANSSQTDTDNDGQGDACDADDDNDGVLDGVDNCPLAANTNQLNTDGDALGNVCDPDDDNDGVLDGADNCPLTPNPTQTDSDRDGQGDACDTTSGVFPIVFTRFDTSGGAGFKIFKINSDGTGLTRLTSGITDFEPALAPDRTRIVFQRGFGEIYRMNADGSSVVRLTNDLFFDMAPDWRRDSASILFSSYRFVGFFNGSFELIERPAGGSPVEGQWTTDNFDDLYPAYSPVSSKMAFSSNRFGSDYEIVVYDPVSTIFSRLTTIVATDTNPSWSPDGTKIAFATNRHGNYEIYSMNADGSGLTRLTNNPAADTEPWWGPDGRIVFTSNRHQNTQQIHIMNADGGGVARLTNGAASINPHW